MEWEDIKFNKFYMSDQI